MVIRVIVEGLVLWVFAVFVVCVRHPEGGCRHGASLSRRCSGKMCVAGFDNETENPFSPAATERTVFRCGMI